MTDWTGKWDKNERKNNRINGQPVFPIKLLIITAIFIFCFTIGFGMIASSFGPSSNIDCGSPDVIDGYSEQCEKIINNGFKVK